MLAGPEPQQYGSELGTVDRAAWGSTDPKFILIPPEGHSSSRRGTTLTSRFRKAALIAAPSAPDSNCAAIWCWRRTAGKRREAEKLVAAWAKELLVISQDTLIYGVDLKHAGGRWKDREVRANMLDLARELGELDVWVRLTSSIPTRMSTRSSI